MLLEYAQSKNCVFSLEQAARLLKNNLGACGSRSAVASLMNGWTTCKPIVRPSPTDDQRKKRRQFAAKY